MYQISRLEAEDIDDPQIEELLAKKAKILPVRILAPTLAQIPGNTKALSALIRAGVTVKTISSPYMHAKLILVDDTRAYVGSVNLSRQSLNENRELGIILAEGDTLQTLSATFASDWDRGNVL